ncbi:MAG: reactive intermediate/imine deaminase [Elusimicrobia bacterium]|nr:reactive intermediate/imine deaminase [Elusimicrobiota bacterium]
MATPIGPYSPFVARGGWVFVSGQIGADAEGRLAPGIEAQTEQCLRNLESVLAEAGLNASSVVKTTVFMADLTQFASMNEVYARHFKPPFPARATVGVAALPKGALVEIEAVAVAG